MTNTPPITPVLLLIFDGFGIAPASDDNPINLAKMPTWKKIQQSYPYTTINASGKFVGLPDGQFGNSEVGHLEIGAGRIVLQDIERINTAIQNQSFFQHPTLLKTFQQLRTNNGALHVLGLLSDGGVHSHQAHFSALLKLAQRENFKKIYFHIFLDGRDTPPISAERYLHLIEQSQIGKVASISGRYYGMDRDNRWERIQPVYDFLTQGKADYSADTATIGLRSAYERGETDEFVKITQIGKTPHFIGDGDAVLFMNFRADRARQISSAFMADKFTGFTRQQRPTLLRFITLTDYFRDQQSIDVLFPHQNVPNTFGEVLARQGLKQLRIAETEKYPHVTFFFSGGKEDVYPGEERILIPSPKVATYDLKPEMSAFEVTESLIEAISQKKYHAIICNYANADMVGHTGNLISAIKAVETLDLCLEKIIPSCQKVGMEIVISADHGNVEQMFDGKNQQVHTQHTTNLVPFVYLGRPSILRSLGALSDISPSLLHIMGLQKPSDMTGNTLIEWL